MVTYWLEGKKPCVMPKETHRDSRAQKPEPPEAETCRELPGCVEEDLLLDTT